MCDIDFEGSMQTSCVIERALDLPDCISSSCLPSQNSPEHPFRVPRKIVRGGASMVGGVAFVLASCES